MSFFWVSVGEGVDRQRWLVEAPDRDSLVHDGWKQPTVGDKILFYVHPHIDPTVRQSSDDVPAWYVGAVLSDGTQLGASSGFWRKRQERRVEQFVD